MANTRIFDEAFQKHTVELLDSSAQLSAIAAQFADVIHQVTTAWDGDGATQWKGFALRASTNQEMMKAALISIVQRLEGVAKASLVGQASQRAAVATREVSTTDNPIFI